MLLTTYESGGQMKLMQILGACALTLALGAFTFAQDAGPKGGGGSLPGVQGKRGRAGGQGGAKRMVTMHADILAQLGLSSEQKTEIVALDKKFADDMKALAAEPGERKEKAPKMKALRDAHHQDLMKILTPEQGKKYDELWKEAMQKARQKGPGGGRGRPGTGAGGGSTGGSTTGGGSTGGTTGGGTTGGNSSGL